MARSYAAAVDSHPLRVAVLEDVPLFRELLEQALTDEPSVTLVAAESTCARARALFPALCPDVVVLDLHLPDGFGFDVGVALRAALPDVRILILSEHVHPRVLSGLAPAERPFWSYLLKTSLASKGELIAAIRAARSAPLVDAGVAQPARDAADLRLELLSPRQREILALAAEGLSNGAIAKRVHMSQKAVEYHLTQVYQQLEVDTDSGANARVQAVLRHVEHERTHGR